MIPFKDKMNFKDHGYVASFDHAILYSPASSPRHSWHPLTPPRSETTDLEINLTKTNLCKTSKEY